MSKNVAFAPEAWGQYRYWQETNRKTLAKVNKLVDEIDRMGHEGTGKPEPLHGDLSGYWSRRINDKDRLVYSFDDNSIYILACRFHYGMR